MSGSEEPDQADQWDTKITAKKVVEAVDELPVMARLQFVKNLLLDHGGAKECVSKDSVLVLSVEVLAGAIAELDRRPVGLRPAGHTLDPV